MKAFQRGSKIVIKKNEDYKEIENLVAEIKQEIEKIRSVCEDRSTENFPTEPVMEIIEKCKLISKLGKDITVPVEYLNFMAEKKDAVAFFENVINETERKEQELEKKKETLRRFHRMLEE